MDVYLFSVLLLISIILLLLNFFKKQIIIGVFAGIFFILCGIILWNGISYVVQTNVIASGSDFNITNTYDKWSNPIGNSQFNDNDVVGTGFVLLGLFLLIVNMVMLFTEQKTLNIGSDNDSDNENDEG